MWGRLGWLGQRNSSPTHRRLIADSWPTPRGLIADSSLTHRGLIADSSPTHRELIADSSPTYRGLIADSSRTHRGLIADSSPTHRGLIADSSPTHRRLIADSSPTHRGLIAESSPSWTAPWGNNPGPTLGTGSATWHSRPRLLPSIVAIFPRRQLHNTRSWLRARQKVIEKIGITRSSCISFNLVCW